MIEAKTKIICYESYKDSGIEWLGEIPEHWKVESFKHILTERNEKNAPIKTTELLSLSIDKGVTLYAEKTTNLDRFKDDFSKYKLAHKGDLVFNSMNMIVGAVGVSNYFGCVSPVYYTYYGEPSDTYSSKFYEYLFRSKIVQRVLYSLGKGLMAIDRGDGKYNTLRLKVSRDDLRSMKLPFPNQSERTQIVKFLNDKTTKLDKAISIKEQQINLLKERQKILINKAVTQGLNPNVITKNSGVDWIAQIPNEWKILRLASIGSFSASGIDKLTKKNESEVKIINYTDVYRNSNRIINNEFDFMIVTTSETNRKKHLVKRGDLIFLPSSETYEDLGLSALIDENLENVSFSYHVLRFVFEKEVCHSYKKYLTNNSIILEQFSKLGTGSIRKTLGRNDFRNIKVLIPPLSEQKEISEYIDNETKKIEKAINLKQQEIAKLKEYKSSLINSVVTGKVKVC